MINEIQNFVFKKSVDKLDILYASEKQSPILGAASLVLQNIGSNKPEYSILK